MRKLVSIVTIATAEPIADSDRLDVVTMKGKGWRVVTGRGEFKPGDTAVYFEIDSALPADDERYAFLRDRCLRSWTDKHGRVLMQAIRIRTVKMRGVISQGLVMPPPSTPADRRDSGAGRATSHPGFPRRTRSASRTSPTGPTPSRASSGRSPRRPTAPR